MALCVLQSSGLITVEVNQVVGPKSNELEKSRLKRRRVLPTTLTRDSVQFHFPFLNIVQICPESRRLKPT